MRDRLCPKCGKLARNIIQLNGNKLVVKHLMKSVKDCLVLDGDVNPTGGGEVEQRVPMNAHHDGETYEMEFDKVRLNAQQQRVFDVMKDSRWHTLVQVSRRTGDPEASVSARLRDLRKPKFGGYQIERRRTESGLHEYRMLP